MALTIKLCQSCISYKVKGFDKSIWICVKHKDDAINVSAFQKRREQANKGVRHGDGHHYGDYAHHSRED